jgi:hypothetical protein
LRRDGQRHTTADGDRRDLTPQLPIRPTAHSDLHAPYAHADGVSAQRGRRRSWGYPERSESFDLLRTGNVATVKTLEYDQLRVGHEDLSPQTLIIARLTCPDRPGQRTDPGEAVLTQNVLSTWRPADVLD